MADSDTEQHKKLTDIFEEGHNIYEDISNSDQPTNSGDVQVSYFAFLLNSWY